MAGTIKLPWKTEISESWFEAKRYGEEDSSRMLAVPEEAVVSLMSLVLKVFIGVSVLW